MMTSNQALTSIETTGYSRMQKILHWAVVVMIASQYLVFDSIGRYFGPLIRGESTAYNPITVGHLILGILILIAACARLGLRLRQGEAVRAKAVLTPLDRLAKGTLDFLYALMIAIPISGLAAWFAAAEVVAEVHALLTNLLLVVMALHVTGALFHQFVIRDGLLKRML